MTHIAKRVVREAMSDRIRYVVDRRKEVAKVATSGTTSDDVASKLISDFEAYVCSHLGRNADGTTLFKTCRIRDHKHRASRRRTATQNTFAHNVDLQRAWTHFRSHFIPGGAVWVKLSRNEKRRIKCAVYQADIHVRTYGDYVGAYAMIRGE